MSGGISDESTIGRLLQHMNSQIPSKRDKLSNLLRSQEPHYFGRNGARYEISRDELTTIERLLKQAGHRDIRLPIILFADASQSQSVWRVEGEEECAVVLQVLDREAAESRTTLFLYAPHLSLIRRTLPTTTACMFVP
ncbi:MAG TPA: DUF61 family protein [Thermoplasmata archaeon]|jgi:uncharacterized protein (UPF0216 family)